jgi:hypothetical protein
MTSRRPNRLAVILDLAIGAAGHTEKILLQAVGETITPKKKEAIRSWRMDGTYPRIHSGNQALSKPGSIRTALLPISGPLLKLLMGANPNVRYWRKADGSADSKSAHSRP